MIVADDDPDQFSLGSNLGSSLSPETPSSQSHLPSWVNFPILHFIHLGIFEASLSTRF